MMGMFFNATAFDCTNHYPTGLNYSLVCEFIPS